MAFPKKIILHIGTQKTASTLIRHFLKDEVNTDRLARDGITLVDRPTLTASDFFAYLERVNAGRVAPDAEAPQKVLRSLQALFCGGEKTVLVTSEIMFRRLPLEDFYQHIGAGLKMMQHLMPGVRIEMIFYVRQQKIFVESCYTQLVQMGRDLSFEEYIGVKMPEHLMWSKVCDDITDVIGWDALQVRAFEIIKELGSEGFLRDFLTQVGLSETQIDAYDFAASQAKGRAANRGFSQVAVDMARFTMPMLAKPKQKQRLRRFLQENYSTVHYPRPTYFSNEEAAQLQAFYAQDNARLFTKYIHNRSASDLGYI